MQSETRYGPQSYEGILSAVCEAFHCAPDVAERQDWRKVQAIFDYRTARWAVDAFNDKAAGMGTLQRHPELGEMLQAMLRAQTGMSEEQATATLEGMRSAQDGE